MVDTGIVCGLTSIRRAVLSQLPGEAVITSTGARKHYGVASKQPYDERRDAAQPRIWDKYQEIWRTVKQKYRPKDLIFTSNLIESTIEAAPVYPGEGFTTRNCSLVADLSSLGKSHLRKRRSPGGRVYYEVEYNLVVTMETTLMKFSLEIDGEEMRSVQATYE